ncbi:MAG TPA: phosphoribosylformylglycinamidine synthase subunit PurQ [Roseiflexaceae bacterium]|nr:phosphoribosylformylglycinamidine synthase subunit PurQ [Roseiflexaceae bacterium]
MRAPGINRDEDAAAAIELAGGAPERIHVNRIVSGECRLADFAMLIVPGGFSYGDQSGHGCARRSRDRVRPGRVRGNATGADRGGRSATAPCRSFFPSCHAANCTTGALLAWRSAVCHTRRKSARQVC